MEIRYKKKKGQVFVAGAILILVIIAIIFVSFRYSNPEYDKFFQRKMETIDKEMRFSSFSGHDSLNEFSNYVYNDLQGFNSVFIYANYSSGNVKLFIGNYLGSRIKFKLDSNEFNQSLDINNNQMASISFPADNKVRLKVKYTINSADIQENITIDKGITVFTDIMINDIDSLRKKSIYHVDE